VHRPPAPLTAALALVVAGLGAPAAGAASPDELADVDAKAEYAFYTEDARALASLVAQHAALASGTQSLERYQYAHAQFRRLQLAFRQKKPKDAEAAGGECLDTLAKLNDGDPRFVEGLVLEAACAGYVAALGGLHGLGAEHRRDARLAQAKELAPRNPRVLLVEGLLRWYRGGAGGHAAARPSFEAATRAFETVTAGEPGQPSWGEAEAWLYVGRALEEGGELLGARNAYEKSLLAAPEFAAARRHLQAVRAAR